MSIAKTIASAPDRSPRERRDWAEFVAASLQWDTRANVVTCRFKDESAMMFVLDDDLTPIDMLAVDKD